MLREWEWQEYMVIDVKPWGKLLLMDREWVPSVVSRDKVIAIVDDPIVAWDWDKVSKSKPIEIWDKVTVRDRVEVFEVIDVLKDSGYDYLLQDTTSFMQYRAKSFVMQPLAKLENHDASAAFSKKSILDNVVEDDAVPEGKLVYLDMSNPDVMKKMNKMLGEMGYTVFEEDEFTKEMAVKHAMQTFFDSCIVEFNDIDGKNVGVAFEKWLEMYIELTK